MRATLPDRDVERSAPLLARVSNRLARHVRTAGAGLTCTTPLVSFTFDDAPVCACTTGAGLLEGFGARGTFYIAGDLIGARAEHWRCAEDAHLAALHAAGHEIGCHTYTHAFLPELGAAAIAEEARANRERIGRAAPGTRLDSFAFPYGFGTPGAKAALARIYATSRSIAPGVNAGRTDRHYLRANPLIDRRIDAAAIQRLMDETLARSGWLIFYGHDVVENPSPYGCSPALLTAALRAAQERGIPCVTVAEGLRRSLDAIRPGS